MTVLQRSSIGSSANVYQFIKSMRGSVDMVTRNTTACLASRFGNIMMRICINIQLHSAIDRMYGLKFAEAAYILKQLSLDR